MSTGTARSTSSGQSPLTCRTGMGSVLSTSVVLPVQHKFIDTHPTTVEQYAQKLEKEVGYSAEEVAKLRKEIEGRMELQGSQAESFTMQPAEWLEQTFIPDALAASPPR